MEAQKVQIAARKLHMKAQRKNDRSTSVLTWKRKNCKCEKQQSTADNGI